MAKDKKMKVWKCPRCGWIVSNEQYMNIIFDAPCRCKKMRFSQFRSINIPITYNDEV